MHRDVPQPAMRVVGPCPTIPLRPLASRVAGRGAMGVYSAPRPMPQRSRMPRSTISSRSGCNAAPSIGRPRASAISSAVRPASPADSTEVTASTVLMPPLVCHALATIDNLQRTAAVQRRSKGVPVGRRAQRPVKEGTGLVRTPVPRAVRPDTCPAPDHVRRDEMQASVDAFLSGTHDHLSAPTLTIIATQACRVFVHHWALSLLKGNNHATV